MYSRDFRIIIISYTKLDNEFLQNIGGIDGNSFVTILEPDIEENNENYPKMINHSSYYDF